MLRILVAIMMLVSGPVSAAQWVLLGEDDGAKYYAYPAKSRPAEHMVTLLVLLDHKSVKVERGRPYLSTKAREEFDCKGAQWRILSYSLHDGPMGEGNPIYISPVSPARDWEPVSPDSMTKALWNFACTKR